MSSPLVEVARPAGDPWRDRPWRTASHERPDFRQLREAASGCAIVAIILLAFVRAALAADWRIVDEHWYIIEIADQKAGWASTIVHDDGERYRSKSTVQLRVGRGEAGVAIGMESTFIESHRGKPVLMRSRQVMSQQPLESEWVFSEDGVAHTSRQDGRETVRTVPQPEGVWLTPRGVQRYVLERANAGADEITYRTIDPQSGLSPISVRSVRAGEGTHEVDGREIPITIWTTTSDVMPLPATEHWSVDGHLIRQELASGVGTMVMRRVSRDEALRPLPAGDDAPELLFQTFIVPDRPMPNVLAQRRATLRLRVKDGDMPALPSAGAQRVEMEDGGRSAIVRVDLDDPLPAEPGDAANAEYREASSMIDSDDELVRELAARAIRRAGEDANERSRAEAMHAYVYRYITNKGLDTAFASASETARLRTGDCTEHAVLLAAMLRTDGIPARIASGLVYADFPTGEGVDGIFGWHMWTQALINGVWIDLDATLPVPYHAGHVLTSTSSLADSAAGSELASMIVLMGNLEIEVFEHREDG